MGMALVLLVLMILGMQVEAAADERGFVKQPRSLRSLFHVSAVPQKTLAFNSNQYLKHWLLKSTAAQHDGTAQTTDQSATRTIADTKSKQPRVNSNTAGAGTQAKLQKMVSALEEFHRAFNRTRSSQLTIMPRVSSRNSGGKDKVRTAAEGAVNPTTACPVLLDSTASKASADIIPSLTGRNFRKSFPPQTKKSNKRVCFWKYCSQK
ncbi:urotensin II-related peptide [Oreochromis aureus]|uniref:urotensin II-related peptide n=1 Tax=Oreochromis aureus TaxID=47969 RepID=UPI001954825B|nr:urotensin II-related peptide [Oreochromis aureus]